MMLNYIFKDNVDVAKLYGSSLTSRQCNILQFFNAQREVFFYDKQLKVNVDNFVAIHL